MPTFPTQLTDTQRLSLRFKSFLFICVSPFIFLPNLTRDGNHFFKKAESASHFPPVDSYTWCSMLYGPTFSALKMSCQDPRACNNNTRQRRHKTQPTK